MIHFGPAQTLNRAEFAAILYRMEGEPEAVYEDRFTDVPENQYYTDAVMWASSDEVGVIKGYYSDGEKGRFGPEDKITREQLVTMLYRYANYKNDTTAEKFSVTDFQDKDEVSEFAQEAVAWAVDRQIITGDQG